MSNQFLLPCQCGRSALIEVHQAGQTVSCECGQALSVPSLRAIRQLAPAPTAKSSPASSPGAKWSPAKGAVFFAGALLILAGAATSAYSYAVYSHATQIKPNDHDLDHSFAEIDRMTPAELWEFWHGIQEFGKLEPAGTSIFAIAENIASAKLQLTYLGVGMVVVGVLLAVAPTLVGGRSTPPKQPGRRAAGEKIPVWPTK